ncbi:Protein CBG26064 [Caenorhabditis briggsae]|uniref:Protein CBG26064 n=1 Tax=Caenorhabditis briggsae TaxID=6238 RepID=B6ILP7_CAEBR|nr:Protein CBG26064 [Caenorhabditis briggsae]CAS00827.1 Protein CBG26064 [Caenorhabditis briggsae]
METKEYHIGKTVPEMIATLEKYDNECRWATNDSRIANYDETGEYLQVVLRPFPNYEDMPNEELIKRYNHSSHWVF